MSRANNVSDKKSRTIIHLLFGKHCTLAFNVKAGGFVTPSKQPLLVQVAMRQKPIDSPFIDSRFKVFDDPTPLRSAIVHDRCGQ
jgi:hypothetical protein